MSTSDAKDLTTLANELQSYIQGGKADSFIYYLYGLVLSKKDMIPEALDMLVKSIHLNGYLWCAWQTLSDCIHSPTQLEAILPQINESFVKNLFLVNLSTELHFSMNMSVLDTIQSMTAWFPNCTYLDGLAGISYYNTRGNFIFPFNFHSLY